MHLADAFIQSDLQCIRAIHLYCQYVRVTNIQGCVYSTRVLFCWWNSHHTHCTLSLAYAYKVKYTLAFRTPLPSIHLANLRSLPNKTDKLLLSWTNKDFSLCCSVFHGNLAEWHNTGQRITSVEFPADQIWPRRRIKGEIAWRRDVLLH